MTQSVISGQIHLSVFMLMALALTACGSQSNAQPDSDAATLTGETQPAETLVAETTAAPTPAATSPSQPKPVANAPRPQPQSAPQPEPQRVAAAEPVCADCGTISAIEQRTEKGEGTGLGVATGAVLGAIAGREIVGGKRSHRDAAAVAGAIGGGYAGHKVEEKVRSKTYFVVSVRMDGGGTTQTVQLESAEGWAVGDKVRIEDGQLVRR